MSARDLAADTVKKWKSLRRAAKEFGIPFQSLYRHMVIQNCAPSPDCSKKEELINAALESVRSKRLTVHGAADSVSFLSR